MQNCESVSRASSATLSSAMVHQRCKLLSRAVISKQCEEVLASAAKKKQGKKCKTVKQYASSACGNWNTVPEDKNPCRTPVLLSVPESCSLGTLLTDAGLNNFMIRHNTGLSKLDGTLQTLNRLGGSLVLFLHRSHVSIQRTCQALHAEVCLEALQCYSNLLVKV